MRTFRDVKIVQEGGFRKAIITWEDDQLGIYHVGVDFPPATGLTAWARAYTESWVQPVPKPEPERPPSAEERLAALEIEVGLLKARAL